MAFAANSRYAALGVARWTAPGGREIAYVRRRFLPDSEATPVVAQATVVYADRLDRIAARVLGDPELFWQLCDANGVLDPSELLTPLGRQIDIRLPTGPAGPQ